MNIDLSSLVANLLGDTESLTKLGSNLGIDADQVRKLASLGIPAIMEGLNRNASTEVGATELNLALEQHQEDPVEDISTFLQKVNTEDGEKILNHVFTNKKENLQQNLAKHTGLDLNQVSGLLQQFAPLLLGLLGKQKKEQNLNASNLSDLTSSISTSLSKTGEGEGVKGLVTQLLDSDKDGNIIDNLGNMFGGFLNNK